MVLKLSCVGLTKAGLTGISPVYKVLELEITDSHRQLDCLA